MSLRAALLLGGLATLLAGCGGSNGEPKPPPGVSQSAFERQLADAANVTKADFEPAQGRTLAEISRTATSQVNLGLATSIFQRGSNRLAFGLIDEQNRFVYGRSAVYLADSPNAKARGPYPAPADALVTKPAYRSRTAASETDPIAAIYAAQVPLRRPGRHTVLVLSKSASGTVGSTLGIQVQRDAGIPNVGERPPAVATDTIASARGNIEQIDTRVPPARELHEDSLKDVLGKRPVVLLFATPQLCQSRVCGPVVDIALQLRAEYGDRAAFIHQEVYVDNQVDKGLREPLRAFKLVTEPWLFTIRKDGTVAARLEGSFGVNAFRAAIDEALR